MLHVLALDLKDDPELIAAYEAHHRAVWPDVLAHLQRHGVLRMQIWRLGARMTMLMETDDAVYDAARMQAATDTDPVIRRWEELMWTFQAPTPWTPAGSKWTPMQCIFDVEPGAP
jgi:L-rhamnose mutarotase